MQRVLARHDKRIGALEQKNVAYDAKVDLLDKHLETDVPVESKLGQWALRGWYTVLAGAGAYLLSHLAQIIRFMEEK
jgi:hypothetical protein